MDQPITHAGDLLPGHIGGKRPSFGADAFYRLAHNKQLADHRTQYQLATGHFSTTWRDELANVRACVKNMLQIWQVPLRHIGLACASTPGRKRG